MDIVNTISMVASVVTCITFIGMLVLHFTINN
jgi:hypothetical protein